MIGVNGRSYSGQCTTNTLNNAQSLVVVWQVAPWSKTGGLGDVCGSLPPALAARGHRVMVVAPRYGSYDDVPDSKVGILAQCVVQSNQAPLSCCDIEALAIFVSMLLISPVSSFNCTGLVVFSRAQGHDPKWQLSKQ